MRLSVGRQLGGLWSLPPGIRIWTWPPRWKMAAALLTDSARDLSKAMPPRPQPPPEEEIDEIFVKGTGPGGQKINKTNSAVQLRHIPTGIVVKSQATRSRSQNRTIARALLAARLDELHNGAESRTAIVADVKRKRKASATKKARRKYRKLDAEGKNGKGEDELMEEEEEAQQDEEGEARGRHERERDYIDGEEPVNPPSTAKRK